MTLASRWLDRRAALGAGLIAFAGGQAPAQQRTLTEPVSIDVRALPITHFKAGDSSLTRFGRCVFRGGMELKSSHPQFGGLSGIAMDADGAGFLAVSDVGSWFQAKIAYDGARPVALSDCVLAPILNSDGKPVRHTRWWDTESLCLDRGFAYVGVERVNDVFRFDWAKDGFKARGQLMPVPPTFKTLPNNRGCECLAIAPKTSPVAGALVAIAERSGARSAPTKGFILTGPRQGEFELQLKDGFDATDITFLANGDLLVLERFYETFKGVAMRIRRIDGATVKSGALLDGPIQIEADLSYQVDNMEALGLHVTREGETILTLLSDDNFSILQRTLLLQFELALEPTIGSR
ncbi:esterase-like activity of phytase family protein [Terrarubrum flagellatum]|uniref:esterase-like activity of phytase family protein n=1 Tax=Terrirubrum flagellatum TaxID=2895980 RepID=UPI003144EE0C